MRGLRNAVLVLSLVAAPGIARAQVSLDGPEPSPTPSRPIVTSRPAGLADFYPPSYATCGLAGGLRVVAASPAEKGLHVVAGGEWFQSKGFIKPGKSHERTQTATAIGWGVTSSLELAAQVLATTNHDTSTNPYFIGAFGDIDLGARFGTRVVDGDAMRVSVGARGGVRLMQGDSAGSKLGDAASPYGYGLLSVEAGPARFSLDAGYYADRSKNLLPTTFVPDPGQSYAYGVDEYNAVVGGVGFDAPGWRVSPLAEITFRNDLGGAPGAPLAVGTGGARWTSASGAFSLTGALDVGLSGRKLEVGRVRAPDWNLVGAATYSFGGRGRSSRVVAPPRTLALQPQTGILRGRVLNDQTGGPIAGAVILLEDGRSAQTNETGRFQFPPLPKGPVKIAIRHAEFEGRGKVAFVTAGQATTLLFRLTRIPPPAKGTARLYGAVVNPEGRFVAATLSLTAAGQDRKLETDPDGKFRIDLPVGAYAIAFSATGFETKTEVGMLDLNQEEPLTVRLQRANGAASPIRTAEPRAAVATGVIGGKVTGKEGVPVRAVIAIRAAGKVQQVSAGPTGEYQAEVPVGDVEIAVSAIGYATQTLKGKVAPNQGLQLDVALKRPGQK